MQVHVGVQLHVVIVGVQLHEVVQLHLGGTDYSCMKGCSCM